MDEPGHGGATGHSTCLPALHRGDQKIHEREQVVMFADLKGTSHLDGILSEVTSVSKHVYKECF